MSKPYVRLFTKKNMKNEKKARLDPKAYKAIKNLVHKEVKKDVEHKQHTDGFTFTSTWGAIGGTITDHITDIAQGVTDTTRVGDELTLVHIKVRGAILNGTSNLYNDIRIIVFQYKNSDNTPIMDNLLQNSVISGATRSAYSARAQDYMNEYIVLADHVYHLEGGTPNAANYGQSGQYAKHVEFNVPLKYAKKKVQYEAATNAAVNGIYVMVIGSSANVASNPQVALQWAVTYTDA